MIQLSTTLRPNEVHVSKSRSLYMAFNNEHIIMQALFWYQIAIHVFVNVYIIKAIFINWIHVFQLHVHVHVYVPMIWPSYMYMLNDPWWQFPHSISFSNWHLHEVRSPNSQ